MTVEQSPNSFVAARNAMKLAAALAIARISIDRVKVCRAASQETTWFKARVLLDGKPVGYAENEGRGGMTFVHITDRSIKSWFDEHLDAIADEVIDDLVQQHLADKFWSSQAIRANKRGETAIRAKDEDGRECVFTVNSAEKSRVEAVLIGMRARGNDIITVSYPESILALKTTSISRTRKGGAA